MSVPFPPIADVPPSFRYRPWRTSGSRFSDVAAAWYSLLMRCSIPTLALLISLQVSAAHAASPFIVFFESDSTRLIDPGRAILDNVAEQVRIHQIPRLIVAAHADRAGSSSHNLGLSRRRAEAVRDELVRRGLPVGAIEMEAYGEDRPLVPTEDDVAEVQNRRAEIVIVCIPNPDQGLEYMRC